MMIRNVMGMTTAVSRRAGSRRGDIFLSVAAIEAEGMVRSVERIRASVITAMQTPRITITVLERKNRGALPFSMGDVFFEIRCGVEIPYLNNNKYSPFQMTGARTISL